VLADVLAADIGGLVGMLQGGKRHTAFLNRWLGRYPERVHWDRDTSLHLSNAAISM